MTRVGVMIPTYRRPDLARACVMQWLLQSRPPDCICVHQNGSPDSYAWCVHDLLPAGPIRWLHSPETLPQRDWYLRPLRLLLDEGCTHFFWADHDDWYLREHVERCVAELDAADFTVASHCGVLYLRPHDYRYDPANHFTVHSSGGMSSSMAFTRGFAEQLAEDLARDTQTHYADNVLALATLPRFQRTISPRRSTVYVSHEGSLTSAAWLDGIFGTQTAVAAGPAAAPSQGLGPVLYGTLADGYQDVTARLIELCRATADGRWTLPDDDSLRSAAFGDPVPNELKHLVLRALPDARGVLVDRVLRDTDRCRFFYARGVLSVELPEA